MMTRIALLVTSLFTIETWCVTFEEYHALVDFYDATNGDGWYDNSDWEFVRSNSIDVNESIIDEICVTVHPKGITCNSSNHVTAIEFATANNLIGTIPSSIDKLSFLQIFEIEQQSQLIGSIPQTIYNIPNITRFSLMAANISGIIDYSIAKWTQLEVLHVDTTRIESINSTSIALSNDQLWWLTISNNELLNNFEINENICNLKKLEYLNLYQNGNLLGSIPSCIGNLTNLIEFQIGNDASLGTHTVDVTGTIPLSMNRLTKLEVLTISNTKLTGNVLSRKHFHFETMWSFGINNNNFNGTIDDSICDISLLNAQIFGNTFIFRIDNNKFEGNLPNCFFNLWFDQSNILIQDYNFFFYVSIDNNKLSGVLPQSNITVSDNCYIYSFYLRYNYFTGAIPKWISKCTYYDFQMQGNQFTSINAVNWTVQHVLRLDDNQISGTIPNNFCYQVQAIVLRFNKLHGSIPNDLFNCSDLGYLDLSTNRLSKMPLQDIYASRLTELVLNSNQLVINDIGIFLNDTFGYSPKNHVPLLGVLALHDNYGITGDLSNWDTIGLNTIDYITLHDCNIYGELPDANLVNIVQYVNHLTVFNNRISCNVPRYKDPNLSQNWNLVLLGNLFTVDNHNDIDWLQSQFEHASNLYLTPITMIWHYFLCMFAGLCYLLMWFRVIKQCIKQHEDKIPDLAWEKIIPCPCIKNAYNWNNSQEIELQANLIGNRNNKPVRPQVEHFVLQTPSRSVDNWKFRSDDWSSSGDDDEIAYDESRATEVNNNNNSNGNMLSLIQIVINMFDHFVILVIITILTVVYYSFSNYYECGRIISYISFQYFIFMDDGTAIDILVVIVVTSIFVGMNLWFIHNLYKLKLAQSKLVKSINNNESKRRNIVSYALSLSENDEMIFGFTWSIFIPLLCKNLSYICIFCAGMALTTLYTITDTLPKENVLGLNHDWQIRIVRGSLSCILSLISIFAIPRAFDAFVQLCNLLTYNNQVWHFRLIKNRSLIVAILRSILYVICPIIASMIFLEKCGNYWTQLWNVCINNDNAFEVSVAWYFIDVSSTLLTHDSVCAPHKGEQFIFDDCFRQFLDIWIPIVIVKLMIVIINPFIKFVIKKYDINDKVKHIVCVGLHCNQNNIDDENDDYGTQSEISVRKTHRLDVDIEYAMVATNVEFAILFGLVCPLIFCLICVGLIINRYFYNKMRQNQIARFYYIREWQLVQFPILLLVVTLILEQLMLFVFCYPIFSEYKVVVLIMVAVLGIIDVSYLGVYVKQLRLN